MGNIKNWIVNLALGSRAVKYFLLLKGFVSGKKTYLAGATLILQGVMCFVSQLEGTEGLADLLGMLKDAAGGDCVQKIAEGVGLMGLRAGVSKISKN